MAPPSLHKSGRRYLWETGYGPHEVELAVLPEELRKVLQGKPSHKQKALAIPERIPAGKRHPSLVSLAGSMRQRGMGENAIDAALQVTNEEQCDPPKPKAEVREIATWAAELEPGALFSSNGHGPEGDPPKGWTVALAEAICTDNHFAVSDGGELNYYEAGRYLPGGRDQIRRLVKRSLIDWGREGLFTNYRANEVGAYIAADAPWLWSSPPDGKISLSNGILDFDSRELLPHSPEYLSTLQIPVVYDPAARPVAWERRIAEWVRPDSLNTIWELLAWLLRSDIKLQIAALLLGIGGNGKSRLLAAFRAIFGARNVAALSLQQIETSRWATHQLNGKLANICSDLPAQHWKHLRYLRRSPAAICCRLRSSMVRFTSTGHSFAYCLAPISRQCRRMPAGHFSGAGWLSRLARRLATRTACRNP